MSTKKSGATSNSGALKSTGNFLLLVIIIAVFFAAGFLAGRYSKPAANAEGSPQSMSSGASVNPDSANMISSAMPSSVAPASSGISSAPGKGGKTDQIVSKIKAAIPVDWNKYTLRQEANPVTVGKVTYLTYTMWDQDYQEGPQILVDPSTGKVYTYTSADKAPMPASTDPAFDKTVRTFTGTVKDGAMMSVLIKTPDGKLLTVRRLGVDLVNLDNGFTIGNKVQVSYTGVIQGNSMQRAFVKKIEGIK